MSFKTEALAGGTTFFTMAYIVVVNPSILSTPGTEMPFGAVLTATVLLCFSMTLLMGAYARLPFAVAPGMGINAFFTFTLILGQKISFPVALGMVFWAGIVFLVISLTSLREAVALALPTSVRIGAAAGIGLFLTFIGLKNMGLVVADPVTFVHWGAVRPATLMSLSGLLCMVVLLHRRSPFAFLLGIAWVTILAGVSRQIQWPAQVFSLPDFSLVGALDAKGALKLSLIPAIVSILFTDFFDSISTFVGVAQGTGLVDGSGRPRRLREGLIVDAWATLLAGVFGTSSGTAYIESSSGIEMGGRTGWTAVVCALCFLPCLFVGSLVSMVPVFATAPVLVVVGAVMFRSVRALPWGRIEDDIPAFLTLALIPLSFSITQGVLWGLITHVILYVVVGRARELSWMAFGLGFLSVFLLWLGN